MRAKPEAKNNSEISKQELHHVSLPIEKDTPTKIWGECVTSSGLCIVPSLLLESQKKLHINATQLLILLHLIEHWVTGKETLHLRKAVIAERTGISVRQVQRHIEKLETIGLIKRKAQFLSNNGRTFNAYDLTGLVEKLQGLVSSS